jgi:RAQPRD family integrative conjugative element protein
VKIQHIIAGLLVLALYSLPSFASTSEAETLAKIDHELNALDVLVQQAKAQADQTQRITFDYRALEADLDLIKQGIRRHVMSPRTQPRSYPPLKGDYR